MTAIQIYRRAYEAMAAPSITGNVAPDAEESYATDEEGVYETIYTGEELLAVHPNECALLGIVEDDHVGFVVQAEPASEVPYVPTFAVFRYPGGDGEDLRMAWIINGQEGEFKTRITGDAIENDGLPWVPLMQDELDAIDTLTRSMFPEAPEFA